MLTKRKVIYLKVRICKARPDEMHKGWIRISKSMREDIQNGSYVQIIAKGGKVYCQIRGEPKTAGWVEMNEWYRNLLGWTELPSEEVELTIKKVSPFSHRRIDAWAAHPDDVVRVGIALGMISISLGLISAFVAVFPSVLRLIVSDSLFNSVMGIMGPVVLLVAAFVLPFVLAASVSILMGKFPQQNRSRKWRWLSKNISTRA